MVDAVPLAGLLLARQDSNLRPPAKNPGALSAELRVIEGYSPPARLVTSQGGGAGFTQGAYRRMPVTAYCLHLCQPMDSNHGPRVYETRALSAELGRQCPGAQPWERCRGAAGAYLGEGQPADRRFIVCVRGS